MPNFTVSIDDGCASDVRAAELFEKYGVKCVFYWPVEWHSLAYDNGYEPLDILDAEYIASKHEIGSHTVTHRHLTKIPEHEAEKEIIDSILLLQKLFPDNHISKFCPPRGYTNPELTKYTMEVYNSQRLTKGSNLVHIHPASGANDNKPWREKFDELVAAGVEDIECWGHSWEWDRFRMWQEIKEFLIENTSS